jgi:hypothetical protein
MSSLFRRGLHAYDLGDYHHLLPAPRAAASAARDATIHAARAMRDFSVMPVSPPPRAAGAEEANLQYAQYRTNQQINPGGRAE